jgi:hypothetical protein
MTRTGGMTQVVEFKPQYWKKKKKKNNDNKINNSDLEDSYNFYHISMVQ